MAGKIEEARGKRAIIRFEAGKCIHSRNCVLSRPDVFVPNVEGEWIFPDRATPEEIATLAVNCPSGAIQYERAPPLLGQHTQEVIEEVLGLTSIEIEELRASGAIG